MQCQPRVRIYSRNRCLLACLLALKSHQNEEIVFIVSGRLLFLKSTADYKNGQQIW